jgi:hypothetical protein
MKVNKHIVPTLKWMMGSVSTSKIGKLLFINVCAIIFIACTNTSEMKKSYLDKAVNVMLTLMEYDPEITPVVASGIVGNLMQESSLNYQAQNSLGYTGVAQWDPKHRWPAYQNWLKESKNVDSLKTQLYYILNEPKRASFDAVNKMKAMDDLTPSKAAHHFDRLFERSGEVPGDKGYSNRIKFANAAFQHYIASQTDANIGVELDIPARVWLDGRTHFEARHEIDEVLIDSIKVGGKSLKELAPGMSKDKESDTITFGTKAGSRYFVRKL